MSLHSEMHRFFSKFSSLESIPKAKTIVTTTEEKRQSLPWTFKSMLSSKACPPLSNWSHTSIHSVISQKYHIYHFSTDYLGAPKLKNIPFRWVNPPLSCFWYLNVNSGKFEQAVKGRRLPYQTLQPYLSDYLKVKPLRN